VKRDGHGFRVFILSVLVLLLACLAVSRTAILAAPQTQVPAEDPKQNEKKPQDDVKKNTPGQVLKPGRSLKMDVDHGPRDGKFSRI
jgi:hypothetical protein